MSTENLSVKPEELPTLGITAIEKLAALKAEIIRDPQYIDLMPFEKDQVKFPANGVELRRDTIDDSRHEGAAYENRCFSRILSSPGRSVIFGPCLLDVLFVQRFTSYNFRPDAISFDTPEKGKWVLTGLYEFKSSSRNHQPATKLFGFSQLLTKLRDNSEYLPRLFRQTLGRLMLIPGRIEIPEDEKVTVTFVYPTKGKIPIKPQTPFRLKYIRVL